MTGSRSRIIRSAAVTLAAALVLASCGGDGEKAAESPAVTTSPSPSSTVNVPETVELTDVGADLAFGDPATVIHEPDQKSGTVLELTVKKATEGTIKDFSGFILDDYTRTSTPYYVDVTVKNVGEGTLAGGAVPLWGVDAKNTLLPPASFTTTFDRCPSEPLPQKFEPEASFSTCLVFLAPDKGTMEAVSFRPNQEFDPIRWTGEITTPKPAPKKSEKKSGDKTNNKKGKNG
ncbi:MAG TPA: hypothetical protein VFJ83_14705 [Nocardioidaceae bacterium]|nr:hypothetical protein [Nocardioidaceae bacterium]